MARRIVVALSALVVAVTLASCRQGSSRSAAPAPAAPAITADTWATVNGRPITRQDVEKAFQRTKDEGQPLSDEEALAAKLTILEDLIVQEILLAKAQGLNIQVPQTDLDNAYGEAKKNMTEDAFQQELKKRNLSADDMRDAIRRQLLSQKLVEQEVGSKIMVTDQEVINFFNANRAQFNFPEDAYHLAQIIVTPARDTQIANRTGDDAATPQAAQSKVAMLMERLKSGAAFSDLARDYSEDPESAPRGGDLGLVPLSAVKQAPAPLRDAVLNITPGSARVVTQGGVLTIIYVVGKEAAGQRDLSMPEVKKQITDMLHGRKEQLLRTAYLAAARAEAQVVNYEARRVVEAGGKVPG